MQNSDFENTHAIDYNYHRQQAEDLYQENIMQTQTDFSSLVDMLLDTPNILFIGGYANSGKSSLLRDFEAMGIATFSTSRICHMLLDVACGEKVDTKIPANRARMIDFIENGLVPQFGRKSIALAAAGDAWDHYNSAIESVVIETIGGDELQHMLEFLSSELVCCSKIHFVNCRSSAEKPNVDRRKLITGADDYFWQSDLTRQARIRQHDMATQIAARLLD